MWCAYTMIDKNITVIHHFQPVGASKGIYIKQPKQVFFERKSHLFRHKSVVFWSKFEECYSMLFF